MKYYKDDEGYLWRGEDEPEEILDPMLGWDYWNEDDPEVMNKCHILFSEIPEADAILEMI